MKNRKNRQRTDTPAPAAPQSGTPWWYLALAVAGVLLAALVIYSPALQGAFVFDDRGLPFMNPSAASLPFKAWLGVRPLLNASYWFTYKAFGLDSTPYHAVNILLHGLNTLLVFLILRKLLAMAGEIGLRREVLAGIGGMVFLAHPVMTESVAYVSSRSEGLSVMFAFSAFAIYLYAREAGLRIGQTAIVLVLFVAALATKEHTFALPAVFLATDLFWSGPGGVKRNALLYGVLLLGLAVGLAFVWNILRTSRMIGFNGENLTWYQYLFTEFRAVFVYLRLFVLPIGLNVDYDMPPSLTIFDYFAFVCLIALLCLTWLAWKYRREYPLAAYGYVVFLILLAPTSSIVPIRDVIAERRLYLPSIGLLLIAIEFLRRLRWSTSRYIALAAGLLVVLGAATYTRAQVWSDNLSLWQDTVAKSPNKLRPRLQLAYFEMQGGDCAAASAEYERASRLEKPGYDLLVNWAYALDCEGKADEALAKLREAEKLEQSAHLYATMGMILAKQKRNSEALMVLDKAAGLNPRFAMTYVYRGNVYALAGDKAKAADDFQRALALDPGNESAQKGLAFVSRK